MREAMQQDIALQKAKAELEAKRQEQLKIKQEM